MPMLCWTQMEVKVPPAFHIFYATGWRNPVLHYRTLEDGNPSSEVCMCQAGTS